MINLCVLGCPPTPVYKGGREEEAGQGVARPRGGVLLQVGLAPPFPIPIRRRKKEGERRRKRGVAPPSLNQFGLLPCGGHTSTLWAG